jgi:uncharacterized protein YjbI with pentapeptide repeats
VQLDHRDLAYASLSELDLKGADFTSSNLAHAKFTFSSLWNTDLSGATLTNANIGASQLVNADLSGATLTNASLSYSTLTNADLSGAAVTGAGFFGTTSRGFTKEHLYSTASYQQRNLQGISLGDNDLTGWDFSDQDLTSSFALTAISVRSTFYDYAASCVRCPII